MKLRYKSIWNKGELEIEADNTDEFINSLRLLEKESPSFEIPLREVVTAPTGIPLEQKEISYTDDIPSIKATGITNGIKELLKTEWGRQPRKVTEIMDAFEENGIIFDKISVDVTLRRLFKNGKIKRKKVDGIWGYFMDTTMLRRQ